MNFARYFLVAATMWLAVQGGVALAQPMPIGEVAKRIRGDAQVPVVYQKHPNVQVLVEFGVASWFDSRERPEPVSDSTFRVRDTIYPVAHKTLPFGTLIKVINPRNGKKIMARVVDRGPFIAGRVIDLDRYSAKALGISGIGPIILKIFKVVAPPGR